MMVGMERIRLSRSLASENTNMMHFDGSKETERIHYRENEQANVLNQLGLEISVERH